MTDTAPVVASGSPSFDRRSFLATLATAGVMTAGATGSADPIGATALAYAKHPDAKLLKHVAQHAELQADDADFAERCRLIASEPGAMVRLVDQLSRLAGHMHDVAEALAMTVQRVRSVAVKSQGQPA